MKIRGHEVSIIFLTFFTLLFFMTSPIFAKGPGSGGGGGGGGGGKPVGETAVNNLSFPVVWAEGVTKNLPGSAGMDPVLDGVWWYQWGTNGEDPDVTPASCAPDPDEGDSLLNPTGLPLCNDNDQDEVDLSLVAGTPPADNPMDLVKAYMQKDEKNANVWQAGSADWSTFIFTPDWIEWGDNLESNDWYTRSQVRVEVVLFQDLVESMTEYEMRHTSGWGIDEVHGLATNLDGTVREGPGDQATIYSPCARLTIQKLLVEDPSQIAGLIWGGGDEGWTGDEINDPIFNKAVHEGLDGPGYYSAEINVKGRIIYGYTWNVRQLNDDTGGTAAGYYRITFSFDEICGTDELGAEVVLNTVFGAETEIIRPDEEELAAAALSVDTSSTGGGGGWPELDTVNNLTYIDVLILERSGGKKK